MITQSIQSQTPMQKKSCFNKAGTVYVMYMYSFALYIQEKSSTPNVKPDGAEDG